MSVDCSYPSERSTGYTHRLYAESQSVLGRPRRLDRCGAWVLVRPVPGTPYRDAVGCYPMFACQNWSHLGAELDSVGGNWVSLTLVTDPFGAYDEPMLQKIFDRCVLFKIHHVVDLSGDWEALISGHHRRNARRGARQVQVQRCANPMDHLDQWHHLYTQLVHRHQIRGVGTFGREAFACQLQTPGVELYRAWVGDQTVGMTLWYVQADRAYYHLAAYTHEGYGLRASYALFDHVLHDLADRGIQQVELGAGAGRTGDDSDGLNRFKRGWATDRRPVYLCGRVFQPDVYQALSAAAGTQSADYFPAYRSGEVLERASA